MTTPKDEPIAEELTDNEAKFMEYRGLISQMVASKNPDMDELQLFLVKACMLAYDSLTMIDNDEIFLYDEKEGIWQREGKTELRKLIRMLFPHASVHYCKEVIDKIRTHTYEKREIFNPEHLIAFNNCVLDITYSNKWTAKAHSKDNYLTRKMAVDYDPGVKPKHFEFFMETILPVEKDRSLVIESMAQCLMNDYRFQKAFIYVGKGANGKSTLLNVLTSILGKRNISGFTIHQLEKNSFASSKLFQKIANIAPDMGDKALYSTRMFKILTGNDYAEHDVKYKDIIGFTNKAKLMFACNKLPAIYEDTPAIWRRLGVINFPVEIPEREQDLKLSEKLTRKDQLSGILNILLESLKQLVKRGSFEGIKTIMDTRYDYIKQSDIVHAFCDEVIEYDLNSWISKDELFRAQCIYAEMNELTPRTKITVNKNLLMWRPKAYPLVKRINNKTVKGWKGIDFTDEFRTVLLKYEE